MQLLVRAYQVRGHAIANLDPLGINSPEKTPSELTIEHYGWTEKDLDQEFELGAGILPRFKKGIEKMTLREIIANCKKIYSAQIPRLCELYLELITVLLPRWIRRYPVHPHSQPRRVRLDSRACRNP